MPMRAALLTALMAGFLFLPGCLDGPVPEPPCAYGGSEAKLSRSWAYDGGGLSPGNGTITIDLDDETNTGTVRMNVSADGSIYVMEWTQFEQAAGSEFQDGGIVRGIYEHGDSGVGDSLIPKVFMSCAGWGTTALQVNDAPFVDGHTGAGQLSAHFMVLSEGIRDDEGRITKADDTTPYDPDTPSDARTIPGDREIILLLKSNPSLPAANATSEEVGETANGLYSKQWPFQVTEGAQVNVSVSLNLSGPLATGQLNFRILGADGQVRAGPLVLGGASPGSGGPNPTSGTLAVDRANATEEWTLAVGGQAASLDYNATIRVTPPGPAFFMFHFEGVANAEPMAPAV